VKARRSDPPGFGVFVQETSMAARRSNAVKKAERRRHAKARKAAEVQAAATIQDKDRRGGR
jgi:hypothetical protein